MSRRSSQLLAALAVAALLVLTASTPVRHTGPPPAPAAVLFDNCGDVVQAGGHDSTVTLSRLVGLTQPVVPASNVLSCSLGVAPSGGAAQLLLVDWDPLAAAPESTTIALRARTFAPGALLIGPALVAWNPPAVVRSVPHVAEPPRSTVALDYVSASTGVIQTWHYEGDGAAAVPIAYRYNAPFGPRVPLAGPHPVLAHVTCGGDSALQALAVMQSVVATGAIHDSTEAELIQRFRVPQATRVRWVELAFGAVAARVPFAPGSIAILDAAGEEAPPAVLGAPLGAASLKPSGPEIPVWDSHFGLDLNITLEPGHDYWLWVATRHCYGLYARVRTGSEGADFTDAIGAFYVREDSTLAWEAVADQALCFKLIGEPTEVGGVPPGVPPASGFRLRVAPNPVRDAAWVRWSGASGPVRLEVLDARGRRVAAGRGAGDAWTWHIADAGGRPLPAGVYFVRARDGSGRTASERVVVVR